jgi:malate permease and related proteins
VPSYLHLLATVAPVFLVIAAGWTFRRAGGLTAEADASLLRLVVNLLFPCLILDSILGNPALSDLGNLLLAPAVGFGTVALGYAVSYALAPLFGARDPRSRRTFAFTTGLYNYGYLALPLVQSLFDAPTTGVLFIHNMGVEICLWTLGVMLIRGAAPRQAWRQVLNAPVLTILLGLALHFTGGREWLPGFLLTAVKVLGAAALPLALVLTGATYADEARAVRMNGSVADSLGASLLRLGVLPLCFLALARWLPCPDELRRVMLVQAAMPCGMIPVILSKHYGGDPALALRIVFVTTALALLTIPLWIQVGLRWIGG